MIIDTHCHIQDDCFKDDRNELINALTKNNIASAFIVGTDLDQSRKAIELAHKYKNLYAIIGMYPENTDKFNAGFIDFLQGNLSDEKVVAVGEIGLDYHSETYDKEMQQKMFIKQIELADQYDLPLSIHTREAFEDTLTILRMNKERLHGGVIHCFNGSPEIAEQFIKLGFKLGFGGVCTFKNARKVKNTLEKIPTTSILLETDSPYLSPEPIRGMRNEPKNTNIVLDKIVEIRNCRREELEKQILKNTKDTFKKYVG